MQTTSIEEVKEHVPQEVEQLFLNLEDNVPSQDIESLCMECKKMGISKFMYTKIPMFKEIIISSFNCDHCGNRNSEVQFGGKLADFAVEFTLNAEKAEDLNRSVVKSEYATVAFPDIDFEIPPQTQKGSINTIEGILLKAIEGISDLQEERRRFDPVTAKQIDDFLAKLADIKDGKVLPFKFVLKDPSGNSFVQNLHAPNPDPQLEEEQRPRNMQEYLDMGYTPDQAAIEAEEEKMKIQKLKEQGKSLKTKKSTQTKEEQDAMFNKMKAYAVREPDLTAANIDFSKPLDEQKDQVNDGDVRKEVMKFPQQCEACNLEGEIRMCLASIPFFKEIIIMAFSCENCGYKNTEIKQGGGISEKATKITFDFTEENDLCRDVFKSDTAELKIPEIDLELCSGTLGSMYTTMEGLIDKIHSELDKVNPFGQGDSANDRGAYKAFLDRLLVLKEGKKPFTLILDDPLSNCFIYNPNAPQDDPKIKVEVYPRTAEQEDDLGISDMKV